MKSLLQKKVIIAGGSGFVGNFIAATFVRSQASVYSLSRKGTQKYDYKENSKINWLKGDITNPNSQIIKKINEADIIIHAAVTPQEVIKKKQEKTYNSMKKLLSYIENRKKIIYISTKDGPQFSFLRYLEVKREAEKQLLNSSHQGYVLRPGLIMHREVRKWNVPIAYCLKGIGFLQERINFLNKIPTSTPTEIEDIGRAIIYLAKLQDPLEERIYEPKRIQMLSKKLQGKIDNE